MLRKVTLHGALAEQFGRQPIELDVDSPTLLIRGLCSQLKGFEAAFREYKNFKLLTYNSETQRFSPIEPDTWKMSLGQQPDIHLVPVPEGAGWELAAAAAAYIFEVGTVGYYIAAAVIYVAVSVAVSMAVSSIANALSPMPSTSGGDSAAAEEKSSFLFNRVQNVTAPGHPVPLVYGDCLVGSVVVSVSVTTEQMI